MSSLNNAKIMGGLGALLTLIGILVPSFGFIVSIIGFILVFVAVKYISDEFKDKSIFNNFLYFFIIAIIAIVVTLVIFVITFIEVGGISYFNELQNLAYSNPMEVLEVLQPLITGVLVGLAALWVLMIISVIYLRKCYDKIGELTKVKWFNTTGLIFLIGAATIIIGIGFIILIIAMIIEIIAFFSLPDKRPEK
jgi:uncharacterized membrane protein